ncbi:MAG: hypothetical protein M3O61_12390, partial [Gemmatimonadota bacterium]|nr:hypothetical protein [Gemmatimonadota bacterium]
MSRTFSFRACVLSLALFVGSFAPARAQQPSAASNRVSLFSSANTDIAGLAVLSPDARWVAFSIMSSPATARLSVSRVGTGEAQHLTAAGRWDNNPEWSALGDAIYFVSNRPAHTGDQNYYGMTLS